MAKLYLPKTIQEKIDVLEEQKYKLDLEYSISFNPTIEDKIQRVEDKLDYWYEKLKQSQSFYK